MATLDEIKSQIKDLGYPKTSFWTKKEVNYLPEILTPGETIRGVISGYLNDTTLLVTLTDKRIIFLDKGMLYGLKQLATPLEKINTVEHKTGLLFGEIAVWDGSSKMQIGKIEKQVLKPFVNALNLAIENLKKNSSGSSSSNTVLLNSTDIATQLEKLVSLKEKGILSDEEFLTQKTKLLN